MKYLSFLIKPASSLCNMRCKYCFYYDVSELREIKSYGIMQEEVYQKLIDRSLSYQNENTFVSYAFQGGEPTMAGLSFFKNFCGYVDSKKQPNQEVKYAIQTNGYRLNEEWVAFFKEKNFLVGISLDGYKENHDFFRLNKEQKSTFERVMQSISLLKQYQVDYNILCVLTNTLAKHPLKLYRFFKDNTFDYVQLIPCLPELIESKNTKNKFALTPKMFASFYKQFFRLWLKDLKQGDYMSVTLFDNLIPMFKGIPPMQCGMLGFCSTQFVIEANGNVYPCDFYVLDQYKIGNIIENSIDELYQSPIVKEFLSQEKRMCKDKEKCKYYTICQGNCKRLNITYFDDNGYCGYQDFLDMNYQAMIEIVKATMR